MWARFRYFSGGGYVRLGVGIHFVRCWARLGSGRCHVRLGARLGWIRGGIKLFLWARLRC